MSKIKSILIVLLFAAKIACSFEQKQIEKFKLEENAKQYLVGTVTISSNLDNYVLIEGIEANDILISPLKTNDEPIIIRRRNLKRIKIDNGIYFVYRIPKHEIKSNKLNTIRKKLNYIKDKASFKSGNEPRIYLSGNTYEDYAYIKHNSILSCDTYIVELETNIKYLIKLNRPNNSVDFSFFLYELYSLNLNDFVFIFINPDGKFVISEKIEINKEVNLKIYTENIRPQTKVLSNLKFSFRTFNPNQKDIEYTIDWGDLFSDLETYTSDSKLLTENFSHSHTYEEPGENIIVISIREMDSEKLYIYEYTVEVADAFYLIIDEFDYTDKIASFYIVNIGSIDSEPTYILLKFVNNNGKVVKHRYDFGVIIAGWLDYFEVDLSGVDTRKYVNRITVTLPLFPQAEE